MNKSYLNNLVYATVVPMRAGIRAMGAEQLLTLDKFFSDVCYLATGIVRDSFLFNNPRDPRYMCFKCGCSLLWSLNF